MRPTSLVVTAAAVLCAAPTALPAQRSGAHAPATWLPEPGTRWDYVVRERRGDDLSAPTLQSWVAEDAFGLGDGTRCTPVRVFAASGGAPQWPFYLGELDQPGRGLTWRAAALPAQRGAIDLDAMPALWLEPCARPGDRWEWTGRAGWVAGASAAACRHQAELLDDAEPVQVPAGAFAARHVRILSEDGERTTRWDLWLVPDIGLVRDELRTIAGASFRVRVRELEQLTRGGDRRAPRERRLRALVGLRDHGMVAAGPPWIEWIDDLPAAARLPGRIAVVKGVGSDGAQKAQCWYVDDEASLPFEPTSTDSLAAAVRRAFALPEDAPAMPPAHVQLDDLALLLACARAECCDLRAVHRVAPSRDLAPRLSGDDVRRALVEVRGGAPDATDRRVTVLLEVGDGAALQFDSDADGPRPTRR
ncbi:MAG: hypothetical protein AB7O97_03225 [Planctomycetota bacterium]